MKPMRTSQGFTLLELLVVMTIISILAMTVMPALSTSIENARRVSCASNMRQIYMAISMFTSENSGKTPDGHPNNFWGDPDLDTNRENDLERIQRRDSVEPTTFTGEDIFYPRNLIRNNYIFDSRQMYPDYLGNLAVLTCPGALTTRDLPRDLYFMDETFAEQNIDPELYTDDVNEIPLTRLQGLRPDSECVTNEFYTFFPYALETEENLLFLWDMLAFRMYLGETEFMDEQITIDANSFESRNSRRERIGDRPADRFEFDNRNRARDPDDRFGDDPDAEFESRFGHAPGGRDTYFRTATGIGKIFVRDINDPGSDYIDDSQIPLLFDSVSQDGIVQMNHLPLGGNVLYLDGHVEYQKYTETTSRRFGILGTWTFFSFSKLPYTTDVIEFLRANVYDNTSLMNIPPWCANRAPNVPFEPRYWYYPYDEMYERLVWDPVPDPFLRPAQGANFGRR